MEARPDAWPRYPAPAAPRIRPCSSCPVGPRLVPWGSLRPHCLPTALLCPASTPQRGPRGPALPAALGSGADPGESPSMGPVPPPPIPDELDGFCSGSASELWAGAHFRLMLWCL